jgi:Mn-dependent DtxR family transcriptional regulator
MMKPNQDELRSAIVEIGAEYSAIERVRDETVQHLAEIGLAQWKEGEWKLTVAGRKLLRRLLESDALPELLEKNN